MGCLFFEFRCNTRTETGVHYQVFSEIYCTFEFGCWRLDRKKAFLRFVNHMNALALTFLSLDNSVAKFFCWCNEICISYRKGSEPRNRMMLSKRLEREASNRVFPKSSIFIEIPRKNYFKRIIDTGSASTQRNFWFATNRV